MNTVFKPTGNDYFFEWPEVGIEAEVSRLHESSRDGLHAELLFADARGSGRKLILRRRASLTTGAPGLLRELQGRQAWADVPWAELFEIVCFRVTEHFREGEETVELASYEAGPRRWLLNPFIEEGGATVLFGPGGSGKSFLALALALGIAGGTSSIGEVLVTPSPVLYLDWETEANAHVRRYNALLAGNRSTTKPPVLYKRMRAPLSDVADRVAREVARRDIGLVVIDSLGKARGGEPESAEITLRTFNAIDQLRCTALCVDHLSKDAMSRAKGHISPFGSIYTENSARSTWSVVATEGSNSSEKHLILTHRKANNGALLGRRAFLMSFEGADELIAVRLASEKPEEVPDFTASLSLGQQVLQTLKRGAMSYKDIAEELGSTPSKVSSELTRLKQRDSSVVQLGGGMWGLAAGERDPAW